ncbi:F-box domain-containing protein [Fusarium keratoplasticum]|nr:F-box domain-containing protein [Fusarium keratoplasticum]
MDFFAFLEAGWGRGYPCGDEFEEEFEDESDEDLELDEDDTEDFYDRMYRERLDDQKTLLLGHDIIYLAQAMTGLPNCKTLIHTDARIPWGASRLKREVGSELARGFHPDDVEDQQFVQRILQVMLSAVAKSELPVEKLDFYLGHVDEPKSVNPMSLQLLDWPIYVSPVTWTLTSLTSLRLLISPFYKNNRAYGWEKRAMGFFDLFPQLSHFTLAFDGEFDNHTVFPIFSELLKIPQLRVMELARFEAAAAELTKMLLQHQSTLEEITLREVKMNEAGSWTSVLNTVRDMPQFHSFTMKKCLIGDWYLTDLSDEIDEVVSIKDRERIGELAAHIEITSAEMAAK